MRIRSRRFGPAIPVGMKARALESDNGRSIHRRQGHRIERVIGQSTRPTAASAFPPSPAIATSLVRIAPMLIGRCAVTNQPKTRPVKPWHPPPQPAPASRSGAINLNPAVGLDDRGREGSSPPLPPNRACGSPAHGSPVGGFLIGSLSPAARRGIKRTARQRQRRRWASVDWLYHLPPSTPLTSAETMRSVQIAASTPGISWASAPRIAPFGTVAAFIGCSLSLHTHLPALPSLDPVLLPGPLAASTASVLRGL